MLSRKSMNQKYSIILEDTVGMGSKYQIMCKSSLKAKDKYRMNRCMKIAITLKDQRRPQ